jgi:predicted MFS family arabinose efflux permease
VRGRLAPLAVWPFSRLLSSYTLNELGDSVGVVALSILVYDRTQEVAATSAFFIVAKFLPALLAPAFTARLDQVALRRSLPSIYLVEALAFGVLALIAEGTFWLPLVLLLGLVDGTLAITGRGLTRGAVGAVLEPAGMLKEGNALMNMGFAVASVGGAALAGVLVASLGLSTALLVDAASFLAIALVLATTRGLPSPSADEQHDGWRRRLGDGLAFARSHRPVRLLLTGQALALVMFTLVIPIEVVYAKVSLGTTDAGFGVLLASWGAGIVIGSLVYIAVKQRSVTGLIIASTAALGVAYLGMAASGTLLAACLFSVLGGTGNGIQWIAVMTALQEATPRNLQARVTGLLESLGAAMPGVGYLLGGILASIWNPRTAYWVAGAGVMVLVLVLAIGRTRLEGETGASASRPRQPGDVPLPEALTGARSYEHERG